MQINELELKDAQAGQGGWSANMDQHTYMYGYSIITHLDSPWMVFVGIAVKNQLMCQQSGDYKEWKTRTTHIGVLSKLVRLWLWGKITQIQLKNP